MMFPSLRRQGFTLVELLVVIAIIGILIALLLPAVQAAREAARRMQCSANEKNIALALAAYENTHGTFPPSRVGCDGSPRCTHTYQRVGTSGLVTILPHLEQQAVYDMFDFTIGPWYPAVFGMAWFPTNKDAIAQRPPVYVCPSDESPPYSEKTKNTGGIDYGVTRVAVGSYALVAGTIGASEGGPTDQMKYRNTGTFFNLYPVKLREVTDGLSKTMFVGEVVESYTDDSSNRWSISARELDVHRSTANPLNTPPRQGDTFTTNGITPNGAFASRHPGGANFSFGDGHVQFLDDNIDFRLYRAMSTRAGEENFEMPE
jgi:prepilin-type N-terminal cleavage/methylation domain-containing protein/prepilin-type processing-associated H-X9-DG protein